MANTKTFSKIHEFLQIQTKPVTPSYIKDQLGLHYDAVSECITLMVDLGFVEVEETAGGAKLIKYIGGCENGENETKGSVYAG